MRKSGQIESGTGLVFSLGALIKAVLLALVLYIILALIATVAISFSSELETRLPTLALVSQFITSFVSGIVAGRAAGRTGWLHGLGAGVVFLVIISTAGIFFVPAQLIDVGRPLWQILPAVLLSLCGGALGANL